MEYIKILKIADVREVLDKLGREEITYSKMVELLNIKINERLDIYSVSHQRELLLAYEQSKCPKTWWMSKSQADCEVDDFLANNCG